MTLSKRNQKIILITTGIFILMGGIVSYFFFRSQNQEPTEDMSKLSLPQKKEEVKPEVTHEDEAGFSFAHPEAVEVEDITPEDDNSYYTLLTASKNGQEMRIAAKDTTSDDVEAWLENDSEAPQNINLYGATTLGEISATQYTNKNSLFTIVVDKNVLYFIEGPKETYWEEVQNLIASTWVFEGLEPAEATANTSPNIIYEPEEVIE